MNLKIILLCVLILVIKLNGYCQNKELVIKNIKSGKEKVIHEGQKLKITLFNGDVIRGRLKLNDTSKITGTNRFILISNNIFSDHDKTINVININNIESIKIKYLVLSIIGSIITCGGASFIIGGAAIINSTPNNPDVSGIGIGIGIIGITFGLFVGIIPGTIILSSGNEYDVNQWEYYIKTK